MSQELATHSVLARCESLRGSLETLRDGQQAFSAFVDELFSELEQRDAQLADREQQLRTGQELLSAERQQLAEARAAGAADHARLAERAAALDATREQLDQMQCRVNEAQSELHKARDEIAELSRRCAAAIDDQTRQAEQLKKTEQQRVACQRELDEAREQIARLAAVTVDSSALQRELAEAHAAAAAAQAETVSLRAQTASASLPGNPPLGQPDAAVAAQLRELETERNELESELEAVRLRAAELTDDLATQKRENVEDRSTFSAELKQLRKLVERQAEMLTDRAIAIPHDVALEPAPAKSVAAAHHRAAAPAATANDAVVGSVMAQFELLQKDRARRRAKATGT